MGGSSDRINSSRSLDRGFHRIAGARKAWEGLSKAAPWLDRDRFGWVEWGVREGMIVFASLWVLGWMFVAEIYFLCLRYLLFWFICCGKAVVCVRLYGVVLRKGVGIARREFGLKSGIWLLRIRDTKDCHA